MSELADILDILKPSRPVSGWRMEHELSVSQSRRLESKERAIDARENELYADPADLGEQVREQASALSNDDLATIGRALHEYGRKYPGTFRELVRAMATRDCA